MGFLHVNEMLKQLTPREFLEWTVAARLGLDDDGWKQAGVVAASIQNQFEVTRAAFGGRDVKEDDLLSALDFIPHEVAQRQETKEAKGRESIEAFEKQAAAMFGSS